jgi:hypothetical protein
MLPEDRDEFESTSNVMGLDGPIVYGRPVDVSGTRYVLIKNGDDDEFAPISETMAKLLEAGYGGVQEIDPSEASKVGTQGIFMPKEGFPQEFLSDRLWTSDNKRPAVCAVYDPQSQDDESTKIDIAMYDAAPDTLTKAAESVDFVDGEIFSDIPNQIAQVVLPQGSAVLADSRTDQGATISGFTYMISDQGIRHGIADDGPTDTTQKMLGYDGVPVVSVPETMIQLIPKGPALDPYEAKKEMSVDAEVPGYESAAPSESASESTGG